MRAVDPALQTHLDGGATTLAMCWKVTRRDGVILGFTDHDRMLTFGGVDYEPQSGADGAAIESAADLSVDNSEIEGALSSERLAPGALAGGRFDGAAVEIWRVNWADVSQRLLLKVGTIGEVTREGARFRAEIRGRSHALDRTVGRVYQRQCDAILGDARCGVDLDAPAFSAAGAVTAILDDQRFVVSGLAPFAPAWFAHGALTWMSGANAGLFGHVKAHDKNAAGDAISLWTPPGEAVSVGDAFEISAGCDKRAETCRAKFSNLVNFRGFHLMPGNDFAVSYPLKTDPNDGGKR
ncbi:MAG: DUF2163 domain-containing protein [Parvularculaceae bacterium]|nr:DUF2163 domain-containing protein [Parvularculaceae bacterium]